MSCMILPCRLYPRLLAQGVSWGWGGWWKGGLFFLQRSRISERNDYCYSCKEIEKSVKSNFTPRLGVSSREICDVTTIRNTECEMAVPPALLPSFPI